ncbi:MAG: hypothetical protein K8R54_10945 [Bacteroidales bacterium]|nr:hypothetical protein [Bacteroidales bacterium]
MKIKITFVFIIFIVFFSCKEKSSNTLFESYPKYFCDLEKLNEEKDLFLDSKFKNILYKNAHLRSSEKSLSGKYSIKLNKKNAFGLGIEIPIKINDYFKITVWRYSDKKEKKGHLVLSIKNKKLNIETNEIYIQEKEVVSKDSSGWEQIVIKIRIPPFIQSDKMSIYVWQPGDFDVYFDNLKIEKIKEKPKAEIDSSALKIFIDSLEYNKLINIRNEALNLGILETQDSSWVKAFMFDKNNIYSVKMRLKGDWTDHIKGTKWSFRIKMKKDGSWKGMKEFSIQDPKTRFFQYEWLGHKIMEKEGVINPRFDFIPVYINNTYIGIYAYEEHFVKQLIEHKNKREGPILKLSEEGFWRSMKLHKTENKWYKLPVFESSTALPYKLDKTLSDQNLKKQFLIAQNLLYQHKNCNTKISELFDIELAAKYFAIINLTKMYHAIRWHNQRFYYNPVTSKLEIIGFDGYTEYGIFENRKESIIGNINADNFKTVKPEFRINYVFFTDSIFLDKYVESLKKYSDSLYLKKIFSEFHNQINLYSRLLNEEYFKYRFNEKFYYKIARNIRKELPEYIEKIKSGAYYNISYRDIPKSNYKQDFHPSMLKEFIKVYSERIQNDTFVYKIINYLSHEIEVIGIRNEDKKSYSSHKLNKIYVDTYNSKNNKKFIRSVYPGNTLLIKVIGFDEEYSVPINSWNSPKNESPRQELVSESNFPLIEYYSIKDNIITFKTGKITVNKNIIIPQNYKVIIKEGTKLDFVDNSLFLSYSSINISGKKNNKVLIYSSDNSAQGFTVLQANKKSKIEYTVFTGFNTLDYKGWTLTGAVNFYESDVTINNTTFTSNFCEDALNIINSNFIVQDCKFENIFSDAFDSDFCEGKLSRTYFNEIGNDAVDFSGSVVQISDCAIKNAGDKGISGGENSTLYVSNCFVSDSKIGVASKDKSTVSLNNCTINNCQYGLVAFQKKPEFGPGIIKSINLKYSNLINFHLIEKKSFLQLNKTKIIGYDKNTAKRFY